MYIVYQTTNIKNNKIYIGVHKTNVETFDGYIGCGIRLNNPSSYMNPTTPLQYAVKKYGTSNFKRVTLASYDLLEDAFNLEKTLVNKEFIIRQDTYNAKLGGFGGSSYSRKINQFSLNGVLLKEWASILEAADFYSISDTAIHNAIKFKGSSKQFFWSDDSKINITEFSNYVGQTCYKYNELGKYIDTYNSLAEAAKINNDSLQSIQRSVKGGYKSKGFYYSTELHEIFTGFPKLSLKNKSIYVYNLDGNFIITLNSKDEICNFFSVKSTSSITTAIRTNRQYRNYQISLEYKDKLDPLIDKRNTRKIIQQFNLTGDLIEEFESITKACDKFGTGVQKVLRGQQQQCKGFIFKYKS
jgi:hypothetical protein